MDIAQNDTPQSAAPAPKTPRRWPRRVALGASLVVALGAGIGIGAAVNNNQAQVTSLQGQVRTYQGDLAKSAGLLKQASSALSAAGAQESADNAKTATAQQTANANAAAAYKNREAALTQAYQSKQTALAATYQGKETALAQSQTTINQQAATLKQELGQVQANSISADGVYVVGQDIKSGTWHTNGDGGQTGSQCYFATLNDNSGSINSIANNNNFDGPETVDVSGLYALQISGPCAWNLVP